VSITSIVDSKAGRDLFRVHVRRPAVRPSLPVRVPPRAGPPSWMGQAFDYAFRFGFAARWPSAAARDATLADRAVERLTAALGRGAPLVRKAEERRALGQEALSSMKPGPLTDAQAAGALHLGVLEVFGRGGHPDRYAAELDRVVTAEHVEELQALFALISWEMFSPTSLAALNPTFGDGSRLVGGADADLIVDGRLVELKVVKNAKLDINYIRQLVGYAVLAQEFGVDGIGDVDIDQLGVWFARSGELVTWHLDECLSEDGREAILDYFELNAEL